MSRFRVAPFLALALLASAAPVHAQGGLLRRIKSKAQEKLEKKIDSTTDTLTGKAFDKAAKAVTCVVSNTDCISKAVKQGHPVIITDASGAKVSSTDSAQAIVAAGGTVPAGSLPGGAGGAAAGGPAAGAGSESIAAYQNYDFVPGDTIVFDDDFRSDQDGELPAHWKLVEGQGAVNNINGVPTMVLTDGLDARLTPRMKSPAYLGETFTIEFDFLPAKEAWEGLKLTMHYPGNRQDGTWPGGVRFADNGSGASVEFQGMDGKYPTFSFSGPYPPMQGKKIGYGGEGEFWEHWHHGAIAFKNHTMKIYIDQYRVVTAPDVPVTPTWVEFGGRTGENEPVRFTNVRIANGGGMNLIDKLTKDGRIVTHGIRFDVNKSDVKPQSMGTIRQIVAMLKANPALKLEVDGHTDSDGDAAANMTLSQSRADAVKALLVQQGIDASRLTAKGYGATKPIASNDTPEGKANNRRVEFVKQ